MLSKQKKNVVAKAVAVMIADEMIDKEPGTAVVVVVVVVAAADDGDDEGLKEKAEAVVDDYNRNTAGTHNRHTAAAGDHSMLHTQTVTVVGTVADSPHSHIAGAAVHTTENNTRYRKAHQDSTVADRRNSPSSKRWWCKKTDNGHTVQVEVGYTVAGEREMMLGTREVAAAVAG